ncbi:1965_t:CDS:1, partial [Ambispora gerdemannii]
GSESKLPNWSLVRPNDCLLCYNSERNYTLGTEYKRTQRDLQRCTNQNR